MGGGSWMKVLFAAGIAAVCLSGVAQAQTCQSYVGQTITPKTFEQAIAGFGNVAPKGEFETTAQYQARIAAGGTGGPLFISKKPEDTKYFQYDADNQVLNIQSYALHNTNMGWWEAFYEAKPAGLKASTASNIAVVISQTDKPGGTYSAQNSYGASTTVTRIARTSYGIFERDSLSDWVIWQNSKSGHLGSIPMDIATAQQVKQTLKVAFVVVPKAPYLVQGTHSVGKTTISNPTDITETFKIMIADIQCGLVTDGTNKVLGGYAVK